VGNPNLALRGMLFAVLIYTYIQQKLDSDLHSLALVLVFVYVSNLLSAQLGNVFFIERNTPDISNDLVFFTLDIIVFNRWRNLVWWGGGTRGQIPPDIFLPKNSCCGTKLKRSK